MNYKTHLTPICHVVMYKRATIKNTLYLLKENVKTPV